MAVTFYDDALLAKLQKWTAGTEISITGVNETRRLFEVVIDKNNDQPIKLPLITLSRPGGYTILNKNKQPMSYNGLKLIKTPSGAGVVQAIPIGIGYQLDIYTRYFDAHLPMPHSQYTILDIFDILLAIFLG